MNLSALNRSTKLAGLGTATAAMLIAIAAPAQADPDGRIYFQAGDYSCAIAPDGTVGCDLPHALGMSFPILNNTLSLPWPGPVGQVVINNPALPALPGFAPGAFTLPGGNPPMRDVATSQSMYSTRIESNGVDCVSGFMGDLTCRAKGHRFDMSNYGIFAY